MGNPRTYEEWRTYVTGRSRTNRYWKNAGDWFFPTRAAHDSFQGKMFHICKENWRADIGEFLDRPTAAKVSCAACGAVIPDGIRMIAQLLSW